MLCNEKRDAALPDTNLILGHHIITHDLDIPSIALLKELSDNVRLGVEGDAMMYIRMVLEECLEDGVIFHALLVQG